MDWLSKYEQEDRQKAEAEIRKQQEKERSQAEAIARSKPIFEVLRPLVETEVTDVAKRLGIRLNLKMTETSIRISAPRRTESRVYSSNFPYSVTMSEVEAESVRVCVTDDQSTNRAGEPPEGMSGADYYGTERTVVDVRETLAELQSADLNRLIEWLVKSHRLGGGADDLQLAGQARSRAEQEAGRRRKTAPTRAARSCLWVAILSFFVIPLADRNILFGIAFFLVGPLVLAWGSSTRQNLIRLGQAEGRTAVAWALGFGWFYCLIDVMAGLAYFKIIK